jgi:predicted ATPase
VLRDIGLQIAARLQAGRGGAWVLAGPSGIGKTRVASELGRGFSRNKIPVTAARARRPAHGDPEPFGVAIQWIDDLTERNAIPDLRRHGAVLGTIVPKLAQRYGPPPRLPPDAAHARLRKAVIQALTAATRDRPLLLALDDLQWLHRTSIEMLVDLCAEMDTFPVVLVATARTDVDLEALDALARAGASEVTLAPLPAHEIHAVIADMLGTERPPPTLADSLAAHTGGNPFFVAEALRAALAAGFLSQDDEGTWLCASATDLAGAGVPSSVRALLEGRVGALTAPQRQLAAAAAVLGHQFAETDLAQLCPDLYGAEAVNALLRAHVLLCPQPGVLVFEHDLIGEIALEALAISRRIELHTAAADLLEPRTESNPSLWFVVAHHLQQAQLPQREAAARRASARTAIERSTLSLSDAREHLMRALELDPSSVSTQIELESVTRGNKAEN